MEVFANTLTGTRALGGIALNRYIESTPDYESWRTCIAFVLLAITDGDGYFARRGREFQEKNESERRPWNSYGDHIADKILVDGTMLAIAHREELNGNKFYARMTKLATNTTMARDTVTTMDRIMADFQNIDTRAQKEGKAKALKQYGIIALALSPIAKNQSAKILLGTGFLYAAKESITSGISLHKHLNKRRKLRKQASAKIR